MKLTDEQLARKFHEIYERLAPSFGYETRKETRHFDPGTPNGKLMIAVCGELLNGLTAESAEQREQGQAVAWSHYKEVVDALSNLLGQVELFCNQYGEADFETGEALRAMESVCEYEAKSTPPAGVLDGWQPIETAPKDGSLIVVRGNNHGDEELGQHHCIASWFNDCWAESSDWNATSELTYLTHWMPLPASPQPAAQTQEREARK